MNIAKLKQDRAAELSAAQGLLDKATSDNNRALTAEEQSQFDAHMQKADQIAATIERAEKMAANQPPSPGLEPNREPARVHDRAEDKPFANFGEFLLSVRKAAEPGVTASDMDPRLRKCDLRNTEVRAASGLNESTGSEGGFLVNQDSSNTLEKKVHDMSNLFARTRRIPVGANSNGIKIPYVDETSRADGSRWGGVQVYWADEADTATAKKPKFGKLELNFKKLIGLCYATEEALMDAVQLGSIIEQAFGEEMSYVADNSVFRGTGAGQPLGILNSAALVSQAKESSQAAATILFANIVKMKARLWARSWANSAWFINQDAEPQLLQMVVPVKNVAGTENVGGSAAYLPPGGASDAPFGRLLGRPVIPIEQASTVGTVGDIVLADLTQYITIARDMQSASSIHVRFLYDESVFRFTYRIDGQPAWKQALTPANGSNTQSPFVALATRS